MGNGVWTVEIIPAEIQPPPRSPAGASGNRIRIGEDVVTNWGDRTNVCIAFNEQVLLARHVLDSIEDDAIILVENMWATHPDEDIRAEWAAGDGGARHAELPDHRSPDGGGVSHHRGGPAQGQAHVRARHPVLLFDRDMELTRDRIAHAFRKKAPEVTQRNHDLLDLGYAWADANLDVRIDVRPGLSAENTLVMNGNQAIAYGAVAAGMDMMAMYPITPATSVSHQLGEMFYKFGGMVHQAEDEIAAAGVAIGASYSGKVAFTITSGPGLALKTEFLGLSVMTEIPLVVVNVQRGGPSTGLPTKVEQSDLLAAIFGQPGDAPHVVMAPATIEECFHAMITARRIAEAFRTLVIVLTDANLATGVQPFPRPTLDPAWQGSRPDMSPVPEGKPPYDWDEQTGLSRRLIPGTPGGMHTLTSLAHDENSRVAYASAINQKSSTMRSRKMAVLHSTLRPPSVYGPESGDLLLVGGAARRARSRRRWTARGRRACRPPLCTCGSCLRWSRA